MFFFNQVRARHVRRDREDSANTGFLKRLTRNDAGNVSMLFGLMIVPFISFAGLSIDFAAASREKTRIQAALDASALAAGRAFQASEGDEDAARSAAAVYFKTQTGYDLTVNTVEPGTFILSVGSEEEVPTSFMGLLGSSFDTLTVNAVSRAQLARTASSDVNDVEISMMLDVTGSMRGQRIADLKAAASDLVNIVLIDGDDALRVAMAPFSHAVNLGSHYRMATNEDPENGNTCVVERTGDNRYTDAAPSDDNYFRSLLDGRRARGRTNRYWSCPTAEIVPLTSNKQLLLDEIDDLPTHGNTAGHLGTAWAWYLISKNWHNRFGQGRNPSNTTNGVNKIAILMSDGQYNNSWYNNTKSDEQAEEICDRMKDVDNQIEVYAVGFELEVNSTAYNRLRECATDPSYFFPAGNGDELRQAFRAIAFKISELRLVE